jgi:hypothetical protein
LRGKKKLLFPETVLNSVTGLFLFLQQQCSPEGAHSSYILYSLIESAKENGLNPLEYLRCVFERAPLCSNDVDWQKLMPWNILLTPFIDRGVWIN